MAAAPIEVPSVSIGPFTLATDQASTRLLITFGTDTYEGEKFVFDGTTTEIGFTVRASARNTVLA